MPDDPETRALQQQAANAYAKGRNDLAVRLCKQGLQRTPDHPGLLYLMGSSQLRMGNPVRGVETLQRCHEQQPDEPQTLSELAMGLQHLGRMDEALDAAEGALALDPTLLTAARSKSSILRLTGRAEEAVAFIEPLARDNPHVTPVVVEFADLCRGLGRQEDGVRALETLLEAPSRSPVERKAALFRLGHLLDELGRYDEAFERIRAANPPPPPNAVASSSLTKRWTRELQQRLATASPETAQAGPVPVFVVGMPRSGTTLLDAILSTHPSIGSVGESPGVFAIAGRAGQLPRLPQRPWLDQQARAYLESLRHAAPDATHVVDKMPGNFAHLGLISALFPNARIINAVRDPRDVCLSCYFQNLNQSHGYARDLVLCARQHKQHDRLVAHWRTVIDPPINEARYESLVEDPETTIRALLEHVGVPFDPVCLEFERSKSNRVTSSWAQVRRPLYASSAGKWRRYERHLGPMLEELARPLDEPDELDADTEAGPDAGSAEGAAG